MIKSSNPEIHWDFSLNPNVYKAEKIIKNELNYENKVSSLHNLKDENLDPDTYHTAKYIIQEIKKIYPDKDIVIKDAVSEILSKLEVSNNIWEKCIYLGASNAELKEELLNSKEENNTDFLTWLKSRRYVESQYAKLVNDYQEEKKKFSMLLIDIDNFKNINDTKWHEVWDLALKAVAKILNESLRPDDIISRIWWDEFLVILKSSNKIIAQRKSEEIRKNIENQLSYFTPRITCSIWIATIKNREWVAENQQHIMKRADMALYKAKDSWRNKTCEW